MNDVTYLLFLTGLAGITAHELDAIQRHEWRIFPLTAPFDDTTGYRLFVFLHIPLMVALIWFSNSQPFQMGFDLFLILHVGLHWGFRKHPLYEFHNPFSVLLIVFPALVAILHLVAMS